ncbi:MAG TPA: TatD family hydrolase [Candidatus Saccharimonadales bacterium]|nr:TatD family hydrolase [Candidatus Saccharimonadales bacterium]
MDLVDTHCHIHSSDYELDPDEVITSARKDGVNRLICVGTDPSDSKLAVSFSEKRENAWASVGIHPHEANKYVGDEALLSEFVQLVKKPKVVAIGECGLDFFYNHSSKKDQLEIFELQLKLAKVNNLPIIFHVREAFDDCWPIFDKFPGVKGVIHSFSADKKALAMALERGLSLGVNGIATFTKNEDQLAMFKQIPIANLVLETDAPYLTPSPFRGTICQPKHVLVTAEFLARLRVTTLVELAERTTKNANSLFKLK